MLESVDILPEGHACGFLQVTLPGKLGMGHLICSMLCQQSFLAHREAAGPQGAVASTQDFSLWLSGDHALCLGGSCLKNQNQKASGS